MAKQKISFSSILSPIGRHKITSLVVLVVLVVIGIFVYQAVAVRIEKHNFEQARAAIDKIYADIVAQVGQPDSHRRTNECSRLSRAFNNGPIYCEVASDLAYGVPGESDANRLKSEIQGTINGSGSIFRSSSAPASDIIVKPAPGTVNSSVDYYKTHEGVMCSFKYTYDLPSEIDLSIKDPSKKIFELSIGCWGSARKLYYPTSSVS
ncbi:MAG TPA: hypothetical protein VFP35_02280 [Candidatus Saccharimonadales bacterium]|nr:hypothetical protein [Candidatus Saccharimonadales bacterium]